MAVEAIMNVWRRRPPVWLAFIDVSRLILVT